MRCEQCGGHTEVLQTTQKGQATNRRRNCLACGHRFTTRELPAGSMLVDEDTPPKWLRTLSGRGGVDREALMACVRVDRRHSAITDLMDARDRRIRDELLEYGLEDQAAELQREIERRREEGY